MIVLGIAGFARSGKDTFAKIAKEILTQKGYKTVIRSIAYPMKKEIDQHCIRHYNISAFTTNSSQKSLIRRILVAHGNIKRDMTEGRHWVDILSDQFIKNESKRYDIAIVPDVRYDQYDKDEVYWVKNDWDGKLIHLSKYYKIKPIVTKNEISSGGRKYVTAPNELEAENDPKLRQKSDIIFEWEHVRIKNSEDLLSSEYLVGSVDAVLRQLNL